MLVQRLKEMLAKLENSKYAPLVQFIKFGLVGVSNTLISYGIDMLCYYVLLVNCAFGGIVALLGGLGIAADSEAVKTVVATALAFVISVTNSYYWNSRYVFASQGRRTAGQHAKAYFKTMACYAITGLGLAPVIKVWLVGGGTPYWAAALGSLVVTIPLNFILNKFWAFKSKQAAEEKTEQ